MLPFLKKERSVGGSQTIFRKPDEDEASQPQEYSGLEACAQAMIQALEAKDSKALAMAFKDAFAICESYPHEEYSDEQEAE